MNFPKDETGTVYFYSHCSLESEEVINKHFTQCKLRCHLSELIIDRQQDLHIFQSIKVSVKLVDAPFQGQKWY